MAEIYSLPDEMFPIDEEEGDKLVPSPFDGGSDRWSSDSFRENLIGGPNGLSPPQSPCSSPLKSVSSVDSASCNVDDELGPLIREAAKRIVDGMVERDEYERQQLEIMAAWNNWCSHYYYYYWYWGFGNAYSQQHVPKLNGVYQDYATAKLKLANIHNGPQTNDVVIARRTKPVKAKKDSSICGFCFNNARVKREELIQEFELGLRWGVAPAELKEDDVGVWNEHKLNDLNGDVCCPALFKYKCPICGARGKKAHTLRFCPLKECIVLK